MQNASLDELQTGIKISRRSVSNLKYAGDTSPMAERRGTKEPLGKGERGERRSWHKTLHSENGRSWLLVPLLHGT